MSKCKAKYAAHIIVGLGFGDEGKGTMTDFLCRHHGAKLVVRYNGGSQAAHNVVSGSGKHHTFAQFGSGTFIDGVQTLISRFMLWDPVALADEANVLSRKIGGSVMGRHFIDYRAPVITPIHVASNRIREWVRGNGRHGSCGKGIGETATDLVNRPDEVIYAGDLSNKKHVTKILTAIQERKRAELLLMGFSPEQMNTTDLMAETDLLMGPGHPTLIAQTYFELSKHLNIIGEAVVKMMFNSGPVVFEGAQGVLLDEWFGFHPHTTWSTTTPANALIILEENGFAGGVETIGITRAYGTRHGAGPFPTETEGQEKYLSPQEHNTKGEWQGKFRFGHLDGVLLRYAAACVKKVTPLTKIAVTHEDVFGRLTRLEFCDHYTDPISGQVIGELPIKFDPTLKHQSDMTALLMRASGGGTGFINSAQELEEYVASVCESPVGYRSYGPTSEDKNVV